MPITETLHDHWVELGKARVAPMGGCLPFEWQEIEAYKAAVGLTLAPIEAQTLMDMSAAFAVQLANTNPLAIEPMERSHD